MPGSVSPCRTMAEADRDAFMDGLVRHGHIIPAGVPGAFGRGAVFEDVLARFDALVTAKAGAERAEICSFPPVISRALLEKVKYLESFPHLCGSVHSFFGTPVEAQNLAQRAARGDRWDELLRGTDVVLNPAACYPLYPSLTGVVPAAGRLVTMLNWVYRHEPSAEPTRMQAFRVREYVKVGNLEQVLAWREQWVQRGLELLQSLGLPTRSEVAADPFFGRGGKMRAASQREQRLKFELLVPVISQEALTAIASFNFHQQHFGATFEIRTPDGQPAHTACLGFGLERAVMALFRTHGFEVERWPQDVTRLLWAR